MTFRLSPNSPKSGAFGDRALQPHCSCLSLHSLLVARCSLLAHLTARSGTAPYNPSLSPFSSLIAHRSLLAHLTARSGTAPYNLIALASLFTHCSLLVARPPYGAFGDRALQPHCSCPPLAGGAGGGHPELVEGLPCGTVENRSLQPHCSLLVAHCSLLFFSPRPWPVFPFFLKS